MIAINGLGRIGRITARILALRHPELLSGLNDPAPIDAVVNLLRFDSIYGDDHPEAEGWRELGQDRLRLASRTLPLSHESQPAAIIWPPETRIVVEASGRFTRRQDASGHLQRSVSHVVISAPSPDPDFTAIFPLNGPDLDLKTHRILSNASCTAHATAPILKVIHDAFGIESASLSTVHVATNDQRLLDAPHADLRRARSAFIGMHPTASSAFGALAQALTWMPEGFNGWAIRVPTLNVNFLDVTAVIQSQATQVDLQRAFLDASKNELRGILGCSEAPLVSCDFKGRTESVVVDLPLIQTTQAGMIRICGWHDNEAAYAERLAELVLWMSQNLPNP